MSVPRPRKAAPRHASPGRPKDPGKRLAILEAATELFVRDGYDGTSVDKIAAAAGVSKLTVYSHFGDKQGLFGQVVQAFCTQAVPDGLFDLAPEQPLRERLLDLGLAFHQMVMSPEAVAGYRILCQPGVAQSGFGDAFWRAGPERILHGFTSLVERRAAAGELQVDDAETAAAQLITLLKGEPHACALFGWPCGPVAADARAHVAAAVDMFLRAYGARTQR